MNELATETAQAITEWLAVMIPIVGAVALFGFLSIASWVDARRREREAFFRHELLKKVAESPTGEQVVALLRQEDADRIERQRQKIQLAGWVTLGLGMGVGLLLSQLVSVAGLWAVGAVPGLIGAALIVHASLSRRRPPS